MTDAEVAQITDNPYKADFPLLAANPELSIFGRVLFVEFAFSDFRPRRF